jgi:uncharacterized repeat protein (TIGR01451 family)
MKNLYFLINVQLVAVALFFFCLIPKQMYSQTPAGYCTVLQQPCNQDGILVVTITEGLTPPLTFYYRSQEYFIPFIEIVHEDIYNYIDTCEGLDFINYVEVWDDFGNHLTLSTGFVPPFTNVQYEISEPVCPVETFGLLITINDGEIAESADFYRYPGGTFAFSSSNPCLVLPGNYSVVIFDENNCRVGRDSLYLMQSPNFELILESTPASCTNGTITVTEIIGGEPPYTYLWNTGETTSGIDGLTAGSYYVTVTDDIGCTRSGMKSVSQSPAIAVNFVSQNPTCTQSDGVLTAFGSGGVPPYSFLYNTGATTQTISNLSSGQYSVTVFDSNSCRGGGSKTLSPTTPIVVTYESISSDCNENNGSSELTISGGTPPYNIVWSTFPQQTGEALIDVSNGSYNFSVTDSEGCVRTGSVYVGGSELHASINSYSAVCPLNNGSAGITASSPNMSLSFHWNTGATSPTISYLEAGSYSCTITDAAGCSLVKSTNISESSLININSISLPASCLYTEDGSITAIPTGGTPPYSYYWSGGQTDATATNLLHGHYSVHITDANGCKSCRRFTLGYSSVSDDCYCTISGTAFEDLNDNCVFDLGENPIRNIRINCPPYGSVFTDSNGEYSFLLPTGDYTLSETILGYYPLESCQPQSYNINVIAESGCVMNYNFAHSVNPIHDIQTNITTVQHAVPGYDYIQKVLIKNSGTIAESNIQFGYGHDGQLLFESSSEPLLSQENAFLNPDWYGITESFPVLEPGESKYIYLTYQVPTNIPLGTDVFFTDTVAYEAPMANWQNDYSPWNNILNYSTYTIGSFDPNNKEVNPRGFGTHGFIANSDSLLTYTVNFENTGSYYARKIVVYDTLDTDLDWNSLRPISSSHDCVTRITDDGVAIFTFDDIYLPYQNIGKYGSVTYSIQQKPDLLQGTEISNSAAIVFDFNEPVITNTVLNTIWWPEGVEQSANEIPICVFPNPANNSFSVSGENIRNIELLNSLGQIVLRSESCNNIYIGNQPAGIYFVKIETEKSIVVKKLTKQ